MKRKVVCLTDIGSDIDDALSVLVMLNHPQIDLLGIYTVNGDVDSRSYIAKHMVNLAERDIPVVRCDADPLENLKEEERRGQYYNPRPLVHHSFMERAEPGVPLMKRDADEERRRLERHGISTSGVRHLAQLLEEETYTIFSLAPMTTLARLLREHPGAAQNIERLYIMGGSRAGSLEHNIYYDPLAAQEVLTADVPATIIPIETCDTYALPWKKTAAQLEGSAVGNYVQRMLQAFVGQRVAWELFGYGTQAGMFILENVHIERDGQLMHLLDEKMYNNLAALKEEKDRLVQDLTAQTALYHPERFWKEHDELLEILENVIVPFAHKRIGAQLLRHIVPKHIYVPDIFVPYCFLHPERIRTERKTMECTPHGESAALAGEKHEIVTGVDLEHMGMFAGKYLR